MKPALHRRGILRIGLAAGTSLMLPSAWAHEYFTTNLRISHPWTRATAAGATFAAVCMTFDEVIRSDRLVGLVTPVAAGAEMGGAAAGPVVDVAVPVGRETVLAEEGTFIRLVGLRQALELGRSYPLTLVFEKGGEVEATLDVAYAGRR